MQKKILFLLLTIGLLQLPLPAQKRSEELKKNKKQVETEIANTQELLTQTKKNKNNSLQQISVLRKQIKNREELITSLNIEIFQMEEELDLNIKLSQQLDKKLEYMKIDYTRVVYMAYKNRKMIDKVAFILSADDFSQMYRRFKYYTIFSDNVERQVALIQKTQLEIQQKNEEIIKLKMEKSFLLSGKEQEIKQLEIDRTEKARTAENLKKQEKQLAIELNNKQKKRKELDAAIQKAIQEEILATNIQKAKNKTTKEKANNLKKTESSNEITLTPEEQLVSRSFVSNQGKLPWPVVKGLKISDFGNYPHPDVPSVQIENRGIDILVDENADVRAVFEGEVSGILDVMGTKVMMIRHGEYLTVYQNIKNIKVKKGEKVSTKQVIATVAKGLNASDTELHFEVWKNNNNLNPNNWLSKR